MALIPLNELIFLAVVLAGFSIISYWKKALDLKGIIVALIVGIISYWFGGISSFIGLLVFFVVGELATKFARSSYKKKHEIRSIGNILGNALAPLIALIAGWNLGFFVGISVALADTLSSEIGLLSKSKPRMVTTLKQVEPGTDGGITLLGLIASMIGAGIIGLVYWFFELSMHKVFDPFLIGIVIVSGVIGSLVDSFLGATLQKKKLIGNNGVNFIAITISIIVSMALLTLYIIWLFSFNAFPLSKI